MKNSLKVFPENDRWVVEKDGVVHSIHTKKEAAVKVAKTIAHNFQINLTIQRRNGDIITTRP